MATLGKANGVNGGAQERVDVSTGSRVRSVGGSGLSENKKNEWRKEVTLIENYCSTILSYYSPYKLISIYSPNTINVAVSLITCSCNRFSPVRQRTFVPLFSGVAFTSRTDLLPLSTMIPRCKRLTAAISSEILVLLLLSTGLISHTTIFIVMHVNLATEFTGRVWLWGGSTIRAALPADW